MGKLLQVGVKALLKSKDRKYLLVKRSLKKYPKVNGRWDIVGGRINPGQTLLENLKREIKEETGLDLTQEPKLIAAQDILTDEKHIVRLTYIAKISGIPKLDMEENEECRWLSLGEIKELEDLDFYFRQLLDKIV